LRRSPTIRNSNSNKRSKFSGTAQCRE
jgi:hypothetical protein